MSHAIVCPLCHATLKAKKLPSGPKNVVCPECGHTFQVTPAGITADVPQKQREVTAPPLATPSIAMPAHRSAVSSAWLVGGIIASILLVGVGIIAAIVLTRQPAPVAPEQTLVVIAEKPDPGVEVKPEPPKAEDTGKRQQEFIRLMIDGGTSLNANRYEEAVSAFTEATKLMPDDADAKQKLRESQTGLAKLQQTKQDEDKVRDDSARLVKQGQDALEQKKFGAAVEFFKLALAKNSADTHASNGLITAQDALNREQLDQKKLNEYETFIGSGKAALKGGRYADAIRDFIAAQRVVPNDSIALQFQREAERQLDGLQNRAEKQKEFQRLLELANTALRSKKYDEADKTFQRALQLYPNDADAQKGLADSQKAFKLAQVDFMAWMFKGNAAVQAARFTDAAFAFKEALRIMPDNDVASRALRQSEIAQENQATYFRAMERASNAMSLKFYGDAIAAYNEALRILPNDGVAFQGLRDAQRLFEGDLRNRRDFEKRASAGLQLLKTQRYSEAETELRAALRAMPHHPQAAVVERQARYADAMDQATAAFNARRYQDAIRQYQAALQEFPNDFAARNGLTKARSMSKSA